MRALELKPTHKPVVNHYGALRQFDDLGASDEAAVKSAFHGWCRIIAAEIEKAIDALASQSFSRAEFLKKLDRFYLAIEHAAATIADFSQKQQFLNTVYEKFFQGFCVKVADTHGIVYTPPTKGIRWTRDMPLPRLINLESN